MFPSQGYFRSINCPDFIQGKCNRSYCHLLHNRKLQQEAKHKYIDSSNKELKASEAYATTCGQIEHEKTDPSSNISLEKQNSCSSLNASTKDLDSCIYDTNDKWEKSECHQKKLGNEDTSMKESSVSEDKISSENIKSAEKNSPDFLKELINEAVKKVLTENSNLNVATLDPNAIIKSLDTNSILSKAVQEISVNSSEEAPKTKKPRLYLPPPGTPSYKPTPIKELNNKYIREKQVVNCGNEEEYTPTSINCTEDNSHDGDITDFSSDEDDEHDARSEFDMLEEVIMEGSADPSRKKAILKRKKALGKLALTMSNIPSKLASKKKDDPELDFTKNDRDQVCSSPPHHSLYNLNNSIEQNLDEQKSATSSDNESFLPPSPVFTSSASIESKTIPYTSTTNINSFINASNSPNEPIKEKVIETSTKSIPTSTHSNLPQIAQLSRPNVKSWSPMAKVDSIMSVEKMLEQLDSVSNVKNTTVSKVSLNPISTSIARKNSIEEPVVKDKEDSIGNKDDPLQNLLTESNISSKNENDLNKRKRENNSDTSIDNERKRKRLKRSSSKSKKRKRKYYSSSEESSSIDSDESEVEKESFSNSSDERHSHRKSKRKKRKSKKYKKKSKQKKGKDYKRRHGKKRSYYDSSDSDSFSSNSSYNSPKKDLKESCFPVDINNIKEEKIDVDLSIVKIEKVRNSQKVDNSESSQEVASKKSDILTTSKNKDSSLGEVMNNSNKSSQVNEDISKTPVTENLELKPQETSVSAKNKDITSSTNDKETSVNIYTKTNENLSKDSEIHRKNSSNSQKSLKPKTLKEISIFDSLSEPPAKKTSSNRRRSSCSEKLSTPSKYRDKEKSSLKDKQSSSHSSSLSETKNFKDNHNDKKESKRHSSSKEKEKSLRNSSKEDKKKESSTSKEKSSKSLESTHKEKRSSTHETSKSNSLKNKDTKDSKKPESEDKSRDSKSERKSSHKDKRKSESPALKNHVPLNKIEDILAGSISPILALSVLDEASKEEWDETSSSKKKEVKSSKKTENEEKKTRESKSERKPSSHKDKRNKRSPLRIKDMVGGSDSPIPDLSALDEISQEDWDQLLTSSNDKIENSDTDDGNDLEADLYSDGDEDDINDPKVMKECMKVFEEFNPEEIVHSTVTKKETSKLHNNVEEKVKIPTRKNRVAYSGAHGNLVPRPKALTKPAKKSPAQVMLERYQKLKEEEMALQRKLEKQRKELEKHGQLPSHLAISSSSVSSSSDPSSTSQSVVPSSTTGAASKRRIARAPSNVSAMLKSKESLKAKYSSSKSTSAPQQQQQQTIATTVSKGVKRIAHVPNTESLERPIVSTEEGTKVPQNIRQRYLNCFIDETIKFCEDEPHAYNVALAEETICHRRATTRMVYLNLAVNVLKKLRASQISEAAQDLLENDPKYSDTVEKKISSPAAVSSSSQAKKKFFKHPINPNHRTVSHFSVMASGGQKGSWSIQKPKKILPDNIKDYLTGAKFYNCLKKYILSIKELEENCFPRPDPNIKGKAILKKISTRKKISPSENERHCDRCSILYEVDIWGLPVLSVSCVYHWGRPYKRRGFGGLETRYSCCQGDNQAEGCCLGTTHVSENFSPNSLTGYVRTIPKGPNSNGDFGVYALDCEMCYTTAGNELTRITVVDTNCKSVYETLVKPENPIIDYNTRFSGITEEDLDGVTVTLRDVQAALLTRFSDKTILMGHSLESDFSAMKLIHDTVVDTSVVFPHKLGAPYKRALRNLASEHLTKIIQNNEGGHDSAEDAITCMELMFLKVKESLKGQI